MPKASKIIVVRADYSIPGSSHDTGAQLSPAQLRQSFFDLATTEQPDVVVLDLTRGAGDGRATIRAIRQGAGLPVLVVHRRDDNQSDDYRVCGAAGCLVAPIDLVDLNQAIQRIVALTADEPKLRQTPIAFSFADMIFRPDRNSIDHRAGSSVRLTTLENDTLKYLAMRSGRVCSRNEIAQALYGRDRPTTDRAVDIVINRLRKKLTRVGGEETQNLLQTQFRRGYILLTDVSVSAVNGARRGEDASAPPASA